MNSAANPTELFFYVYLSVLIAKLGHCIVNTNFVINTFFGFIKKQSRTNREYRLNYSEKKNEFLNVLFDKRSTGIIAYK